SATTIHANIREARPARAGGLPAGGRFVTWPGLATGDPRARRVDGGEVPTAAAPGPRAGRFVPRRCRATGCRSPAARGETGASARPAWRGTHRTTDRRPPGRGFAGRRARPWRLRSVAADRAPPGGWSG